MTKILVVDDEPDIVFLIGYYLKAIGYVVATAGSGTEAIEKAEREQPDLVILDVLMPEMTGLQVCQELRRRPATSALRVILFSALAHGDDRSKGLAAGADDYISKPINLQELASRIQAVLNRP